MILSKPNIILKFSVFCFSVFLFHDVRAQRESNQIVESIIQSEEKVYSIVDEMPQFVGGDSAMYAFIGRNLRYPREALSKNITGKVYVSFIVNKTGNVTNVGVLKYIGGGCDEEVIRLIESMPKWIPGKQNGIPVNVRLNLPVSFKINPSELKTVSLDSSVSKMDKMDVQLVSEKPKTNLNVSVDSNAVYNKVDVMPSFPTGEEGLFEFIRKNIVYPKEARKYNIKGRVYATFIVRSDGKITDAKIIRGLGYGCDEAVLQIIQSMPDWIPGKIEGKNVNVQYNLPINFNTF